MIKYLFCLALALYILCDDGTQNSSAPLLPNETGQAANTPEEGITKTQQDASGNIQNQTIQPSIKDEKTSDAPKQQSEQPKVIDLNSSQIHAQANASTSNAQHSNPPMGSEEPKQILQATPQTVQQKTSDKSAQTHTNPQTQQSHNSIPTIEEQSIPPPQPILPEPTPEPATSVVGQVNGEVINYQKRQRDRVVEYQIHKSKQSSQLDYSHVKDYAFIIRNIQIFYVNPDHDVDFKGQISVYWQRDNAFIQSTYEIGEQVQLMIVEDGAMIFGDEFYRTVGFTIKAKKGRKYMLKFINRGSSKLLTFLVSNYLEEQRIQNKVSSKEANQHEAATQKMKNTLRTFLAVVEKSFVMNQQISQSVGLYTRRYMSYQVIELVFVVAGACTQVYLVKRLLNPHSIV